jgi:hypothetical protein
MATDASALVQMARASQRLTALGYNACQILVYDADDKRIDVISKGHRIDAEDGDLICWEISAKS